MNRVLNMIARAVVRRLVDSGGRQTAQVEVTKGELIDGMERMQNYGMSSFPPVAGTDCLVAFLGGNREQGMIVVAENRTYRFKNLEEGEVVISDDLGNVIHLMRDQVLVKAVTKLRAEAPEVEVIATTKVTIQGGPSTIQLDAAGVAITSPSLRHNNVNVGATHTHSGVMVGSGSTGAPNP